MQYHCLQVQITCWNIQGLSSVLYSFSSSKWHSEKEYAPNTYLIQTQLFSNRCFLKLWKIHVKTYLLELLFNNLAGFKTWNFIKKTQVQAQVLSCKFSTILQKALFTKHLDDCSWWFLCFNQKFNPLITLCSFFPSFFSCIIDNCNYGSLPRKYLKRKILLPFTIVYSKININVAILPWQYFANAH